MTTERATQQGNQLRMAVSLVLALVLLTATIPVSLALTAPELVPSLEEIASCTARDSQMPGQRLTRDGRETFLRSLAWLGSFSARGGEVPPQPSGDRISGRASEDALTGSRSGAGFTSFLTNLPGSSRAPPAPTGPYASTLAIWMARGSAVVEMAAADGVRLRTGWTRAPEPRSDGRSGGCPGDGFVTLSGNGRAPPLPFSALPERQACEAFALAQLPDACGKRAF